MNALIGMALLAREREPMISRDVAPPSMTFCPGDDDRWAETAIAVFSLILDPLSILGFPGRLSGGMAVPDEALHTTR